MFTCKQSSCASQRASLQYYIHSGSQPLAAAADGEVMSTNTIHAAIPNRTPNKHRNITSSKPSPRNGPRSRLPLNNRLPQSGQSHDPGSQKARSERRSLHRALQPQACPDGGTGVAEAQCHHVQSCRPDRSESRESSPEAKCISTCCVSRHIAFSAIEPS